MNSSTRANLERIDSRYNPEYDVPDGPVVTWVDYDLLQAIKELHEELESLRARVNELEAAWAAA